jgi:hypothetical protein
MCPSRLIDWQNPDTHTRAQDAGLGRNNWLRVFLSKYFSNRKELHITAHQQSPWEMQLTRHINKALRSSKHIFSHLNRTIRS